MANRPIFIDLSLYTNDDVDFRQELVGLMIRDLKELENSLNLSLQSNELTVYLKACHKVSSTLRILNDQEFTWIVEEIKTKISESDKLKLFYSLHSDIVQSLVRIQKATGKIPVETSTSH